MAAEASNNVQADRRAGFQGFPVDLAWKASRRWRAAHRFIPISARWITGCCAVAVLAALVSLFSVLTRPLPVLFLAYPDGSIRCAPAALDPATGRPLPRPKQDIVVCRQLELKYGAMNQEATQ